MSNEQRNIEDAKSGSLTPGNSLTNSGTTMISSTLAQVMAIGSTQHYPIELDPLGTGNGPERVWITAHTASSTAATIVRGREGTSGVAHTSTTAWVHGPSVADFIMKGTTAQRAALTGGLPYQGMRWHDYDLGYELKYNGTAWYCTEPQSATVATSESTSNGSYSALATPGPAVTVTTGTVALVTISCGNSFNTNAGANQYMSFVVSGATTLAAADARSATATCPAAGYGTPLARTFRVTGLTAGVNVFTAQYKTNNTTATFENRDITVVGTAS